MANISWGGLRQSLAEGNIFERQYAIPEGAPVLTFELRADISEKIVEGDLIKLATDGPLHTVIGKQGNTVYLVEGSYQRKRRPLVDETGVLERLATPSATMYGIDSMDLAMGNTSPPAKQKKEFKPPVIVGKRRIRLDE